jgi:hypothetical protein
MVQMSKKIFSTMLSFLIGGAMVLGQNDDMPQVVQMIVKPYDKGVGDLKKNAVTALEKLQKQYEGTKNEKGLASVKAELARIKGVEGEESAEKMFNDILGNNDPKWISKDATFELSSDFTGKPNSYFLTYEGQEPESYAIATKSIFVTKENGSVKINLGNIFSISKLEIMNRTGLQTERIIGAEIFFSADNKKWSKVETIKKDNPQYVFEFKNKKAQYIKIMSNAKDGVLTLKSCKIYGK